MEHRGLRQADRRHWRVVRKSGQVAVDTMLNIFELDWRVRTVARKQIEAELRVEDLLRQGLKRKQAGSLLLQFSKTGVSAFAGRFEDLHHGMKDGVVPVNTPENLCQHRRRGMRDHVDGIGRYSVTFRFEDGST